MQLIQRDFDVTWDFRSIAWAATLRFNLIRAACAGLVLCGLMLAPMGANALAYPLLWPLLWAIVLLPMAWLIRLISRAFPAAALANVPIALMIAIGDPLVCFLKWIRPQWVEMENPPLFALQAAIVLFKPNDAMELVQTRSTVGRQQP